MFRSSCFNIRALLIYASVLSLIQHLSTVDGHNLRRHHHHHDDDHHEHHHHHHHHHEHGHRHLEGGQLLDPDVFDSCMVLCYSDIVYRYGEEFAEKLKSEGFTFEECPEEGGNSTTAGRALGATDQPERRWNIPELRDPDGKLRIPYVVQSHSTFDEWDTYSTIAAAIDHIEKETGVLKFVPRTTETNYILYGWDTLTNGGSCASHVGRQNSYSKIFLGWCVKPIHKGNIIHETLHSLGFWHEHSRPDRDDYVTFHEENLSSSGYANNFQKSYRVNSLGSPYDLNSIMHYPPNAFSKDPYNSVYNTLVPKVPLQPGEVMGQRVGLSEHDINQIRLMNQCSTGVRSGSIGINELCTPECKCWEYAGECSSDDECMGDLVCADTPDDYYPSQADAATDSLPPAEVTWDVTTIDCDRFCHQECCQFPNNAAQCTLTCSSQTSRRRLNVDQIPSRMCLSSDPDTNELTTTTTTTTTQATTTTTTQATTTTTTTTTTPNNNNAPWYIDWSISKCVQSCEGAPPCGGIGQWVTFHSTMEVCCNSHLAWMQSVKSRSYEGCHIIPDGPAPPTNPPSPPPTNAPVTESPTKSPTHSPTEAPVTESPTSSPTEPPTKAPITENPTSSPTNPHPTAAPTKSPSKSPTTTPTKNPTGSPTTKSPTMMPTQQPTGAPTKVPTKGPTSSPTTPAPTKSPTPEPTQPPTAAPTNQPTNPPTTGPPSKPPTPSPTNKPTTGAPSKSPTPNPTPAPTEDNIVMYSGQYYVAWDVGNGRCVRDCDGPRPCGGKKDPWESGFATESICCSTMSYKPYSECSYAPPSTPAPITPGTPTRQPTNKPTTPQDTRWYNADSTCKNDGKGPSWSNKYGLQSTCCSSHFSWDYNNCMGIENNGSGAWYIDWGRGKCVKDCKTSQGGSCGGLVPGSWILTHTSANACCTAHMSYASNEECIYNP